MKELHDFQQTLSLVRKTKPTAEDLQESKENVKFVVYDAIVDGTFEVRLDFLCDVERYFGNSVEVLETNVVENEEDIQEQLSKYLEDGFEGQILRTPNGLYEGKRSKNLIKHKEFEDDEFEIVSIEEGKGNWAGAVKRVEIRLKDGTTQFSGVRGSFDFLKELLYNADDYIGTDVTVRYQNKTDDDKLRFPVIVTFWKGKRDL
jgi:DNA ligase-1